MVRHIVVWRLADIPDKAERAAAMKENVKMLRDGIDFIKDIEIGINFNESEAASDVVLVSTFETKEDLEAYQVHPIHKEFGRTYVRPYVSERRVADYEF